MALCLLPPRAKHCSTSLSAASTSRCPTSRGWTRKPPWFSPFSSSVLAAFAVLFTVPALKIGVNFWTLVFFVLVAVSAIAYGLVLWFLYWAVRASEWRFDPPVNVLSDNVSSGKYTDDEILLWTAEEIDRAIEANRLRVERKATSLGRALFVVVVEAACLTLAALAAFPLK